MNGLTSWICLTVIYGWSWTIGQFMTAKVYCWKKMYKKGISGFWIIFIIVIVLLVTSTQKIAINDKQIATASVTSCGLINQAYDSVNRVCMKDENNQTIT